MIKAQSRWTVYIAVLLLILVAMLQGGEEPVGTVALAQATIVEPPDAALQPIELERLQRQHAPVSETDPFAARSWRQIEMEEQRRNAPAEPPPPPQAPPLPFAYLGKMIDGGQTVIFLSARDRNYVARVGDTLDGVWRVERIGEQDMSFNYVPLKLKQRLSFAAGGARAAPARQAAESEEEQEEEEEK